MNNGKIKVLVCGAAGNMGKKVINTVLEQDDMQLISCVDIQQTGQEIGKLIPGKQCDLVITNDLESALDQTKPDVMIDFTGGEAAPENVKKCLAKKVACVVGSTGISNDDLKDMEKSAVNNGTPVFIAPNFSVGAVLMMQFAKEAARHYDWAEIIEMHHEKKVDAPSGTALRTVKLMTEEKGKFNSPPPGKEKLKGVRGGEQQGIRVHSVRMPGLLAHQVVKLGGLDETLTIRHDSLSRKCFMPGVMLAVRKVRNLRGLVVGLENII